MGDRGSYVLHAKFRVIRPRSCVCVWYHPGIASRQRKLIHSSKATKTWNPEKHSNRQRPMTNVEKHIPLRHSANLVTSWSNIGASKTHRNTVVFRKLETSRYDHVGNGRISTASRFWNQVQWFFVIQLRDSGTPFWSFQWQFIDMLFTP